MMSWKLAVLFAAVILCSSAAGDSQQNEREKRHRADPWSLDHCWDTASNHLRDPFCDLYIKSCSAAPEVEHGSHDKVYNRSNGATVNYVCDDGFQMQGPEVITCTNNMTGAFWSTPPSCIAQCSRAPEITNGNHNKSYSREIGSQVNYVCDAGYTMRGNDVITCKTNVTSGRASWSIAPTCLKITCPAIPDIENGYHDDSNATELGTIIQYYCNENYIIEDKDSITCVKTDSGTKGQWTKPLPSCKEMLCRPPASITNGQAIIPNPLYVPPTAAPPATTPEITTTTEIPTTTTDFLTTTTTETPLTDALIDAMTQLPDLTGNTTEPEVVTNSSSGEPDANDDMSNSTDASSVTTTTTTEAPDMSNETNTEQMIADTTTTDLPTTTATIATTLPTAVLTSPTTPIPTTIGPYMGIETNATFSLNETITYRCNKGYGFVTNDNVYTVKSELAATCVMVNKNAVWSTTISCIADCRSIPEVDLAKHTNPDNTLQGSNITYTCKDGYHMIGESTVTCLETGRWSELPHCTGCSTPPKIAYGSHNTNYENTINSTVYYVCDDGFTMLGPEVITCGTSSQPPYAKWTDAPSCNTVCPAVPSIKNGEHTTPDNLLNGVTVTYSCLNGSYMSGPSEVVCLASGNWSALPECSPICVNGPPIPNSLNWRWVEEKTDKVTITCEEHYVLVGNNTLSCIGGEWTTPFPHCECVVQPIDIVFIIDASGSLGKGSFNHTLEFVVDMVQRFPIETSNFGLLTFASTVQKEFGLDEFTNDTVGLINSILATKYTTGGTDTYSALSYARTHMFTEEHGMRQNVSHTAIIVTDGQSNDFNETVHQAELLKAEGVTIYSVGIGITNQEELKLMASKPEYVFTVDNYDLIDQIAGPLAGITCSSTHSDSIEEEDDIPE